MWDTVLITSAIAGYLAFVVSLSVRGQRISQRRR
jgi:hypothetical protein